MIVPTRTGPAGPWLARLQPPVSEPAAIPGVHGRGPKVATRSAPAPASFTGRYWNEGTSWKPAAAQTAIASATGTGGSPFATGSPRTARTNPRGGGPCFEIYETSVILVSSSTGIWRNVFSWISRSCGAVRRASIHKASLSLPPSSRTATLKISGPNSTSTCG